MERVCGLPTGEMDFVMKAQITEVLRIVFYQNNLRVLKLSFFFFLRFKVKTVFIYFKVFFL